MLDLEDEYHQLGLLLGLEEIILVGMAQLPAQVMEGGSTVKTLVVAVVENCLQLQVVVLLIELP